MNNQELTGLQRLGISTLLVSAMKHNPTVKKGGLLTFKKDVKSNTITGTLTLNDTYHTEISFVLRWDENIDTDMEYVVQWDEYMYSFRIVNINEWGNHES